METGVTRAMLDGRIDHLNSLLAESGSCTRYVLHLEYGLHKLVPSDTEGNPKTCPITQGTKSQVSYFIGGMLNMYYALND